MMKLCALSLLVQAPEPCSQDECAFWQPGGDDLEAGCAIERLELHLHGQDVAGFLLSLRDHHRP